MARVENEAARVKAAMERIRMFPIIDQEYRLEIVLTDEDRYQIVCEYLDMEGWITHSVLPGEALADTPEEAVDGWNRLIEEKGRV